MILCLLAYMLCFMPTLGLTASLSFKHLANSEKDFPAVRVLGTIGWIAGNWVMWGCRLFNGESEVIRKATTEFEQAKAAAGANETALNAAQQAFDTVMSTIQFSDNSPHIFHAAAIASAILGVYCLTLPKTTPPKGNQSRIKVLGVDAWALLKANRFRFCNSFVSGLHSLGRLLRERVWICRCHGRKAFWFCDRCHEYRSNE